MQSRWKACPQPPTATLRPFSAPVASGSAWNIIDASVSWFLQIAHTALPANCLHFHCATHDNLDTRILLFPVRGPPAPFPFPLGLPAGLAAGAGGAGFSCSVICSLGGKKFFQ